jgi:hypothetical protein
VPGCRVNRPATRARTQCCRSDTDRRCAYVFAIRSGHAIDQETTKGDSE